MHQREKMLEPPAMVRWVSGERGWTSDRGVGWGRPGPQAGPKVGGLRLVPQPLLPPEPTCLLSHTQSNPDSRAGVRPSVAITTGSQM